MRSRRVFQVAVALAMLTGPLAAVAHAFVTGTVTTAPVAAAAPAIGVPMLVVVVVLLAAVGGYGLRRTHGGVIAKIGFAVALSVAAGLAYATNAGIIIEGADCGMTAAHQYDGSMTHPLVNSCPNAIRIVSIDLDCILDPPPSPCSEGLVLAPGASCGLPFCDCQCEGIGSEMRVCSDGAKFVDPTCAADNCACTGVQGAPTSCTAYFDCSSGPVQINYTCNNPDDIGEDAPGTCSSAFCDCVGFDYVCEGQTEFNSGICLAAAGCVCVGYTDGGTCGTGTAHFDCSGDGVADTDIPNFYCENNCPRP